MITFHALHGGTALLTQPLRREARDPMRDLPRLRLSTVESDFVAAAMTLILPDPLHPALSVDPVAYVESQFGAEPQHQSPLWSREETVYAAIPAGAICDIYRHGIAAVEAHCRAAHGTSFRALDCAEQHGVLSLLEDGCSAAGLQSHTAFFALLVRHAAEAYFDATQIPLRSNPAGA